MKQKKSKRMSVTDYARSRGRHESSVRRAIASGYIDRGEDRLIDPDQADRDWFARHDTRPKAEGKLLEIPELYEARAMREVYAARRAKLDFERESAELVEREDVNRWFAAMKAIASEELLKVGPEIQDELAEERSAAAIGRRIESRIRVALTCIRARLSEEVAQSWGKA